MKTAHRATSTVQTMETYSHLLDGIGGDTVDGLDYALSGPGFWPNMDILRVSRRCVSGDRGRHIPIQQPTAREEV